MKKKLIIVAVAVVAVVAGASILIATMRDVSRHEANKKTPEYALLQARKAVKNHDTVSFEKYVDVAAVVDDCVDPLLEVDKFKGNSDNELVALAELVYRKLRYPSRSQLAAATRYKFIDYVETGEYSISNKESETATPEAVLTDIWYEVSGGDVDFEGIEYVNTEGDRARIGLTVRFGEYKETLVLDLVMENRGEYWQVTGLGNFSEFMQQLVVLRNRKVLQAMNQTLVLKGIDKSTTDGTWGIGKKVIFEAKVKNKGNKEINRYALKVICVGKDGQELDSFVVTDSGTIPPGNEGNGFWYRDISLFTGKGKMLYEMDRSDMRITTSVESIVFADNSMLELWGNQEEMG